jgi:glycerate kinase
VHVLVAPDKFRGTLSARQAADAIALGWKRGDPGASIVVVPMADGGEGTLDVLLTALQGEEVAVTVTGPLGHPVTSRFGMATAHGAPMGIVEMSAASGFALVPPGTCDPTSTTTRGTGELILAACMAGARRILVSVGGSATNDAGAGVAQALGIRLLDTNGEELGPGGAELVRLDRIDIAGRAGATSGIDVLVATDVDNPLTGPEGASAVYGPQKGATAADVDLLDRALSRFADIAERDLGVDVRALPGGGAAGGLGAGLVAFLGARLMPGARVVMDAVGFDAELRLADLVVTGEGSFDEQSLRGKVPGAVIAAALIAGVACVVLSGRATTAVPGVRVVSMVEGFGGDAAMRHPRETLEALAAQVSAEVAAQMRPEEE